MNDYEEGYKQGKYIGITIGIILTSCIILVFYGFINILVYV